ncbi:Bacterial general secretion pathway protein H [Fulvimarina pelagi HTCC2506]|uniref:Bacterial general secretion pathway protein H n=1 Tax=Fulvimarina pelagi HTCC2506 TaxID=314231 RepID=Q0G5B4_9HYPH|nr:OpgC domain-containing protein [Fulvimarina pelagi]EAU43150.1 Bacterial general secretion pathway protein H [Fulvimarina pelagi HTCC2506]
MTIVAPKPVTARDNRIDFWRGVALIMIFVNHVPGTFWESYTSRNFGFSDAAELFVFLAGFAAAFAYGRPFLAGQRLFATVKAFRRAGTLFLVQMTLTVLTIGLFAWATLAFGEGEMMHRMNLAALLDEPLEAYFGLASFGHQFGYVNILPLYIVLLLMVPLHLWLASISRELMLGSAIALWASSWLFYLNIPAFPNPGGWFFNPIAWQLIFAAGLYGGLRKADGKPSVPYRPWLLGLALAYLLFAFVTTRYGLWFLIYGLDPLPPAIASLDKTFAAVPRVLHVLALAYVFANAVSHSPFAKISRENIVAAMGRHSLPIFAFGTMLSLVCQVIKFGREQDFVFDTGLLLVGLALQFALVQWLEWWGTYQKTMAKSREAKVAPSIASRTDGLQPQTVQASYPKKVATR